MHSPGRLGRSFIATLSVGIVFGFGFAYVLLNINTASMQQSSLTFFQPQRFQNIFHNFLACLFSSWFSISLEFCVEYLKSNLNCMTCFV